MTVVFQEHGDGLPPAATLSAPVSPQVLPMTGSRAGEGEPGHGHSGLSQDSSTEHLFLGDTPGLPETPAAVSDPSPFTGHPLHHCLKALPACLCSLPPTVI